ncbi:hypothetical protein NP233_g9260 [Leucocoprinus birnbaumii]|uniref:F-box domain-containing protein n=1 Tax=Leucocoprinus birnbaumii TaxID=56174 RepID=A0AAD5YT23_9AGAR|nr:hypothetical protein NP233_g9260 [Leucocoprinus birnbaumii]
MSISDINALHPDLLCCIFRLTAATFRDHLKLSPCQQVYDDHFGVQNLRLVCKYWDRLCVFDPRMWSTITIYHAPWMKSPLIPKDVLKTRLERSQQAPLDIYVCDAFRQTSWYYKEIFDELINPEVARWRSVHFDAPIDLWIDIDPEEGQEGWANGGMNIENHSHQNILAIDALKSTVNLVHSASPSLKKLVWQIWGSNLKSRLGEGCIPNPSVLQSIQYLELHTPVTLVMQLLRSMENCAALEVLKLETDIQDQSEATVAEISSSLPVYLPSLQVFVAMSLDEDYRVVNYIDAPNLRAVEAKAPKRHKHLPFDPPTAAERIQTPYDTLRRFLLVPHKNLEVLRVEAPGITEELVLKLLDESGMSMLSDAINVQVLCTSTPNAAEGKGSESDGDTVSLGRGNGGEERKLRLTKDHGLDGTVLMRWVDLEAWRTKEKEYGMRGVNMQ